MTSFFYLFSNIILFPHKFFFGILNIIFTAIIFTAVKFLICIPGDGWKRMECTDGTGIGKSKVTLYFPDPV